MDLTIRYLLHGQPDKYNSEDKLYIISRSDSLWSKLAHNVLGTNESWRLIDKSLSESISEEKFEQIGITRLTPSAVIELLKQKLDYIDEIFAQISLSDDERRDILNEIGKNIDNNELWRLLPLHKSSENKLVGIKKNTYLENRDYKLNPQFPVKVILINQNSKIIHYPKEGWISQWSASAEMKILLKQSEDHNYAGSILRVLQSFPNVKREYRDELKNTQWLRLLNGYAIAPKSILRYPDYLRDHESYLIQFREGYRLVSDLSQLNYQPILNLFNESTEEETLLETLDQDSSIVKLEIIVKIISRNQGHNSSSLYDNKISRLRSTTWLLTIDNVFISPSQVIHSPELETEIQNIIDNTSNKDWITPLQLHNEIRDNQIVLKWLNNRLFIKNDEALEVIGGILSKFPEYYLGEFSRNEFSLKDALAVFNGIDDKILPAWNLIEQTSRIHGKEKCSRYILNSLLAQAIQESKLIDLLGWLSNGYEATNTQAITIYNQYLALAVNRENFGNSILPHILLLNRLGQWKSPRELCVNTPNIAEQYILDEKQEEIIQGYLDEVSRIDAQKAIDDQKGRQAQENTITLQDYFQDWHSHVYSEAIGAFICLIIGGNQESRKFTRTLLRNRDIDLLTERLLGSFVPRSFPISESRGETQEVKSLIGDISFHADKRTGKTNNIFVNNLDRHTNRFVLAHLNPSEYNREELSNLLKESARLLIQSVYQVSNVNESIDKVWGSLIKSEQLDVAVARNVILESADSIIKFLSVHNRHEGIKRIILDLNESISKREEYRTYNRDYQNIDLEIYSLKQQLGKILEDNSRENTASSIVL